MSWGVPNRPKISTKIGRPTDREGADGDIQIKGTGLGAKLFAKWSSRWWDVPLSIDGVTKIGVTDSDYLSIDRDSVDIYKNSVKVAEFGSDIKFNGKIIIGNADGTFNPEDNVNIGNAQSGLGLQNISIGYQAGEDLAALTSSENVLIGYSAGKEAAGAVGNTCIGSTAGDTIITGSYNVCIGHGADASATHSQQVAIGRGAVTTGNYGIAIGRSVSAGEEVAVIGVSSDYITCDFGENATWDHSSDLRIKKDIADNNLGLSFINDLRTVNFKKLPASEYPVNFNAYDKDITVRKNPDLIHYGFIAQEVKEAMDKANHSEFTVWKEGRDGMQSLGETEFITPIIKAVQELSAKLDTMQTEINNLK